MKTELTTITPEIAQEYLKRNTDNRPLRRSHVETLRQSFEREEYVTTHQGIAFDRDGILIDGQHRLAAIALMPPGFKIRMLVTTGLDRQSAFAVIDATQAKRSTSDALGITRELGEVSNFLAYIYSGTRHGATPAFVAPFAEYARPEVEELIAFCAAKARTWSSAPVRAAAVIQMKYGDKDYTMFTYDVIVRSAYSDMTPAVESLYRGYTTGRVRATDKVDMFVRCMRVFDPRNENIKHLKVVKTKDVTDEVRAALNAEVFNNGKLPARFLSQRAPQIRRRLK